MSIRALSADKAIEVRYERMDAEMGKMTDEEYIRKGVMLADGWEITLDDEHTEGPWVEIPGVGRHGNDYHSRWTWVRDLLAAQLVRQTDHPSIQYVLSAHDGSTVIYKHNERGERFWEKLAEASCDDRTLNTIKAIVDSKVLEND